MQLSVEINNAIVDFLQLLPNMDDKAGWEALINRAILDDNCKNRCCNFNLPNSSQIFQSLIAELEKYGTLDDGRHPVVAVLEAAKDFVGKDKRESCDRLIRSLREHLSKTIDGDRRDRLENPPEDIQIQSEQHFVPSYVYDIFVSYVFADDAVKSFDDEGWVTRTVKEIKEILNTAYRSSGNALAWLERSEFTPEILSELRQSAIFLVFLSENYMGSSWNNKEFFKMLKECIHDGSKNR